MDPENNIDATQELVKCCEEPQNTPEPVEEMKTLDELSQIAFVDLTDTDKKQLITGLKNKVFQLDHLSKKLFEENNKLKIKNNENIKLMEDTLTFIKTTVGNAYGSLNLAIKNMEREVK